MLHTWNQKRYATLSWMSRLIVFQLEAVWKGIIIAWSYSEITWKWEQWEGVRMSWLRWRVAGGPTRHNREMRVSELWDVCGRQSHFVLVYVCAHICGFGINWMCLNGCEWVHVCVNYVEYVCGLDSMGERRVKWWGSSLWPRCQRNNKLSEEQYSETLLCKRKRLEAGCWIRMNLSLSLYMSYSPWLLHTTSKHLCHLCFSLA